MVQQNIDRSSGGSPSFDPDYGGSAQMDSWQRRNLSLEALRRTEPLVQLAERHGVSRTFVYRQMAKATAAVDQAFQPAVAEEHKVLFHLPVTRDWLKQLALSLMLTCHSPFRGVRELLETMFDYHDLSQGSLHNLLRHAVDRARQVITEPCRRSGSARGSTGVSPSCGMDVDRRMLSAGSGRALR
jgi:hypothetical protein